MKNLSEQLISYSQKDYYPFHMPGHKRNPFSVEYNPSIKTDITEIEGFDNLHYAEGIIEKAQRRAANLYGSKECWYSVNGSTVALLSAISACTSMGGKILMARNCHKSVYHGVYIRQLTSVYLYPRWEESYGLNGGISPEDVRKSLEEEKDIQAVLITSPTYDGVVSDVEKIAVICHEFGVPLIVDEAHGAHFPFHVRFPNSALTKGADVVIQSLHKTLPSMTQTALLHRGSELVSGKLLDRYMGIYQSSSPSYPLMASMDACICQLEKHKGEMFANYVKQLTWVYQQLKMCQHMGVVDQKIIGSAAIYDWDFSKIILTSDCVDGHQLYQWLLSDYHLQMEMVTPTYVLGITSVADTKEGFHRLVEAVCSIDERLSHGAIPSRKKIAWNRELSMRIGKAKRKICEAMDASLEMVPLREAAGCVLGEFVSLYPPGIPLIVPGECLSEELITYMEDCLEVGYEIHGPDKHGCIGVVYE